MEDTSKETDYPNLISRGWSQVNDDLIAFIKPFIKPLYLDIGCNGGFLLSEVAGGIGVEKTGWLVDKCLEQKLTAIKWDAHDLPFKDKVFRTSVLSTILHQSANWEKMLLEGIRVAETTIGIENYPGRSVWGTPDNNGWVKSIVDPEYLGVKYKAEILDIDGIHYFFKIN